MMRGWCDRAGLATAIALLLVGVAAAQSPAPAAPDHCRWSAAPADAWTLSCAGLDGVWAEADLPYDIDSDTVTKARSGDPAAMIALGLFYLDGPGAPRDAKAGLTWLRSASDHGSALAQRRIGEIYYYGYGAPKDLTQAAHAFSLAAEAGDAPSMALLANLYTNGAGVTQDYAEAARWSRAAASKGDVDGMRALGLLHYRGAGVPKDDGEAVRWLRMAADKGDAKSAQALAFMTDDGLGTPKDEVAAKRLRDLATSEMHWTRTPSPDDLQVSYPTDAAAAGIVGKVYFRCEVAPDRTPHHCQLQTEDPPGYGFARAGRSIVGTFQLGPGLPAGSIISVPIRYALPAGNRIEPRQTADTCAAYAIALQRSQTLPKTADWWARYWRALSRRYAVSNGETDTPQRLEPLVADAVQRLADGRDKGLFGRVGACHLKS